MGPRCRSLSEVETTGLDFSRIACPATLLERRARSFFFQRTVGRTTATSELRQSRTFVHRDMVSLIAFDLILWFVVASVNRVSLEFDRGCDHANDPTVHAASLRIPTHVIARAESTLHDVFPSLLSVTYHTRSRRNRRF